mmetsp:Transcript_36846/g.71053  ORF Transcript_36846/g.71053 Transcript_36846/m.71053 type:complete len:119 (+) Transcript_36846:210-566(+)
MALTKLPRHPNVLEFLGVVSIDNRIGFLAGFCSNGSLDNLHDKEDLIEHARFVSIARDVCQGLGHLHSHNVIHRDIACRNLLLKEDRVVIADYGLCRTISDGGVRHRAHMQQLRYFFF